MGRRQHHVQRLGHRDPIADGPYLAEYGICWLELGTISALYFDRMSVSQLIGVTGAVALFLIGPLSVLAADAERPAAPAAIQTQPDFLFGRPDFSVGVRGVGVLARADSNIFEFTEGLLTLEKSDFNAPGIAIDLGFPLTSRLDAQAGFEFSRSSAASHYRDFTDADDIEIEQTTSLSQVNLSGGIELAVLPRGRAVGQYAWVPAAVTPYVGAGAGLVWYRFEQQGDFVDFVDNSIFTGLLQSSGWTPGAHVFTGVDVKVARQVLVTGEVRYQWADTTMTGDFADPNREVDFLIDLTGLRISGGVQVLF